MTPEREARSRRHLDRLKTALRVEIDGHMHEAVDWSVGGFAIAAGEHPWRCGQKVRVRLMFPVTSVYWGFDVAAEVANLAGGRIGFAFVDLQPDQIDGLQRMRLACIAGRIMSLDAMLTPPDTAVAAAESQPVPPTTGGWRRLIGLAALVVLGPMILATGLVMLHDRLLTLRGSHAAVTVPALRVRMPVDGVVRRTALPPGAAAPAGEVLFELADAALLADIHLAEAELVRQTAQLEALRRRYADLTAFFAEYVELASAGVRRSEAAEAQARQGLELAERDLARIGELHATGHVAQTRMDEAQAKLAAARKGHLAALGDRDQAQVNLRMARNGRYFTGSRVEGGEPARLADDIRRAEREHGLQSLRLAALMERRAELAVTSPCDCVVVGVAAQAGEWLRAATEVYLLRPAEASPTVTVKLPHEKVRLLQLGGEAVLRLPRDSTVLRGRIDAISHTPQSGRFGLPQRLEEDATYATVSVRLPAGSELAPGTPAMVAFPLDWHVALADRIGLALRWAAT